MVWITTPNIAEEAWHQLLALANEELAIERLTAIHGAKYSQKNYKKQARQIRVSLLQAREYFRAAAESTLYTSPNHMYYGMVALASALMLLWGDGTKSLDYLRADTKNRSHGLRFSIGITASNASQGLNILTSSCVEVLRHGHFMNWYETLPDVWPIFGLIINHLEPGRTTTSRQQQGSEKLLKASEIAGLKKPLLTLTQCMPDLAESLRSYGAGIAYSRCNYEVHTTLAPKRTVHMWRIHEARTAADMEAILEQFGCPTSFVENFVLPPEPVETNCIVQFVLTPENSPGGVRFRFPSCREDLNNETYYYGTDIRTHEIVDAYLVSYGLSMLSRYYPDYWIICLESHCKAAKLIERLVDTLLKKFPVMALSLMTRGDIVISNHRPSWF